ncbi:MAG: helix-turn-helix transcriptional regulator [Chloroflexia bacterium]
MQFGEKLKMLRAQQGLTLTSLAAACGLTKGFISQLEAGRSSPSLASLAKLAEALGTTPAEIISEAAGDQEQGTHKPHAHRSVSLRSSKSVLTLVDLAGSTNYFVATLDAGSRLVSYRAGHSISAKAFMTIRHGLVRLRQAGTDLSLSEGDLAAWDAAGAYVVENNGVRRAEILICLPSSVEPPQLQAGVRAIKPVASAPVEGPFRLIAMRAERRLARGS